MNILFFASDNSAASGAFLSMAKLCELLERQYGHKILVILPKEGTGETILTSYGVRYKTVRSYSWIVDSRKKRTVKEELIIAVKKLLNLKCINECVNIARNEKIDLIHINTLWSYVGAETAKKCKLPYAWHIREFLEEDQNAMIWNKEKGYKLISNADQVICISESVKKKYSGLLNTRRIRTIYNGIDSSFYSGRENLLLEDKMTFLIVGSINENKGQDQIVKACVKLLKSGFDQFKLYIVGKSGNNFQEKLQTMIPNEFNDRFSFEGVRGNVKDYFESADITFVCSKAEAFGRVTVEAMLSGSLVIGSNTGGTAELIKDNETGYLYEYGNVDELADKILYVQNNREKARQVAAAGREYMMENMTAEANAKNVNSVYHELFA